MTPFLIMAQGWCKSCGSERLNSSLLFPNILFTVSFAIRMQIAVLVGQVQLSSEKALPSRGAAHG